MPIYEYLCRRCNRIFQFLVRVPSESKRPACPKCGETEGMERMMSSFSVKTSSPSLEDMDEGDLAGLDSEDPREMARMIRSMADEMGEDLGPEVNEALTRLENGEDPEKIERDLAESGFDMGDAGMPTRDPGLYEA